MPESIFSSGVQRVQVRKVFKLKPTTYSILTKKMLYDFMVVNCNVGGNREVCRFLRFNQIQKYKSLEASNNNSNNKLSIEIVLWHGWTLNWLC